MIVKIKTKRFTRAELVNMEFIEEFVKGKRNTSYENKT